jgi:hypothetical protein
LLQTLFSKKESEFLVATAVSLSSILKEQSLPTEFVEALVPRILTILLFRDIEILVSWFELLAVSLPYLSQKSINTTVETPSSEHTRKQVHSLFLYLTCFHRLFRLLWAEESQANLLNLVCSAVEYWASVRCDSQPQKSRLRF